MLTDVLGFTHEGGGEYRLQGGERRFRWAYDPAPAVAGRQGAGTVHHIAWASRDEDHLAWQERDRATPTATSPTCATATTSSSIYFREPRGVLFEIATLSPGFAVDEDPEHLGEALRLPGPARAPARAARARADARRQPAGRGGRMSALIHRERPAGGDPAGLLVLHHGRGADEHDLLGLADVLDPERRLHVVTPRAPLQLPGWPGNHWYVVPRVGYPDHDTFHAAYGALAALHDELWERTGIDAGADRLRRLLDGLGDELRARPRPGPPGARRRSSPSPASSRPSTAGSPRSPTARPRARSSPTAATTRSWTSAFARRARELLEAGGLHVEYHESDAAHHIDPAHVPAAVEWLRATLD